MHWLQTIKFYALVIGMSAFVMLLASGIAAMALKQARKYDTSKYKFALEFIFGACAIVYVGITFFTDPSPKPWNGTGVCYDSMGAYRCEEE